MAANSDQTDIAILNYPGAQLAAVHGLTDLFLCANGMVAQQLAATGAVAAPPPLRISHWQLASDGRDVEMAFVSEQIAAPVEQLTAVIVPPSLTDGATEAPDPLLLDWLVSQHRAGAVLSSVCAGAFLLAESGLLAGRPATTHWVFEESFAARYPAVRVETDKLIVEDGDIITAGGVMAWANLGLRLVDRFVGSAIMLEVARFFLVDPSGREQRFYSCFAPRLQHGDAAILNIQHWLQSNCDQVHSVATMAAQANLSERTFLRRFQKATGMKPTAYLQMLRVGKARELLEFSAIPFQQIAWQVGYEDPGAFRKVFQRIMGLSPGDYRRRFHVS
ncbi:MAG: GlxA family transcriptional regulator [Pseudomonadota bacterium]